MRPTSLLIGMVWVPVIHFYAFPIYTLHSTLESGQEARIVQIFFIAAFDKVNLVVVLFIIIIINWSLLCKAGRE